MLIKNVKFCSLLSKRNILILNKTNNKMQYNFTTARDDYFILGIKNSAGKNEIKNAYYKLAKMHHPDKNKENSLYFHEIQNAYEKLMHFENSKFKNNEELELEKILDNIFLQNKSAEESKKDQINSFCKITQYNFNNSSSHLDTYDIEMIKFCLCRSDYREYRERIKLEKIKNDNKNSINAKYYKKTNDEIIKESVNSGLIQNSQKIESQLNNYFLFLTKIIALIPVVLFILLIFYRKYPIVGLFISIYIIYLVLIFK
jgi:hypothetical protein